MWLQHFTQNLLRHRIKAAFFACILAFVPIVGLFSIIFATLVTLVKGALEGGILVFLVSVSYLVGSFALNYKTLSLYSLGLWIAIGVALLSNLLTWVLAIMLRKGSNWSTILQVTALIGVLAISILHLVFPDIVSWWGNQLYTYYAKTVNADVLKNNPSLIPAGNRIEAINAAKQYATGLITAGILFNGILQLIIARWWQMITFKPASRLLRRELHSIRFGYLAGVLFSASLILAYMGNEVVLDMMPVLFLLFTASGLSLLHTLLLHFLSTTAWFWLALLYLMLIFAIPTSLIVISVISLCDIWFDFRKRIKIIP